MTGATFPWRRLGELLVEKGVLTEGGLRRALEEQQRTGKLLGQILVEREWVSPGELAAVIGEQHGIELDTSRGPELGHPRRFQPLRPDTPAAWRAANWRPVGRILVEKELLGEITLYKALAEQKRSGRLLGEILVERGAVSASDLAEALAEQHGFGLASNPDLQATLCAQEERGSRAGDTVYEVRRAGLDGQPLHRSSTFLDATDFAFDVLEQQDPDALEIVKVQGEDREVVWSYARASG